jgi:hypothetical protein
VLYEIEIKHLSHIDPSSIKEAWKYENWVNVINGELDQIEKNKLGNWFQDQK